MLSSDELIVVVEVTVSVYWAGCGDIPAAD